MKTSQNEVTTAKDIMADKVVSVSPEESLLEASDKMVSGNYSGLPVISESGRVLGIITEYDMLSKGTRIHLPTFMKFFAGMPADKKKGLMLQDEIANSVAFKVQDVMNVEPILFREDTLIDDVVNTFSEHHRVNPVPVTNREGIMTGIVSRFDVIKFYASMLRKAKGEK